jgi:hypothetical protein
MKTHKFARKPFYVDAVRISEANIEEVAQWCEGSVELTEDGQKHVKVKVHRPLTDRQTQAFVGDWVLFAGTGFKVYTPKAFDKSFEKVKTLTKAQADLAGIKVPHEPKKPKVGTVGQALIDAQKKAPVPAPPKTRVVEQAEIQSVSLVEKNIDPSVGEIEVAPGITASPNLAPQFSEIVVDREIPKTYTEEEKDANARAAIEDVLKEG